MRRKLLSVAGALVIVLALAYVARPAGHIPIYDANLVRLAESKLEAFCAGETFWKSNAQGNAQLAGACRVERAGTMSAESNLLTVEDAFCRGIVEGGWGGTVPECLEIMRTYQYWPTYDGALTYEWNRARPYPRSVIAVGGEQKEDDSRTGERQAPSRTSTAPTYAPPAPTPTEETETTTDSTTTEEEQEEEPK